MYAIIGDKGLYDQFSHAYQFVPGYKSSISKKRNKSLNQPFTIPSVEHARDFLGRSGVPPGYDLVEVLKRINEATIIDYISFRESMEHCTVKDDMRSLLSFSIKSKSDKKELYSLFDSLEKYKAAQIIIKCIDIIPSDARDLMDIFKAPFWRCTGIERNQTFFCRNC